MNAFREGQQVLDQCACIHLTISAEHARGVTCKKPENSCESVLSSGLGGNYTASAFNAVRFRMINFGPSNRISCFCLSLVKSRVTVSRDAPILSAISSWVMSMVAEDSSSSAPVACDSNNLANLPDDERDNTRS